MPLDLRPPKGGPAGAPLPLASCLRFAPALPHAPQMMIGAEPTACRSRTTATIPTARLSWVSDKKTDGSERVRYTLQFLYPLAGLRTGRIGAALGQNIYTPNDTDAVSLVRDERSSAGWL